MFNPFKVLFNNQSVSLDEESSLKDFYIDNVEDLSQKIIRQHKDYIEYQKELFQKIKKQETTPNDRGYEILHYKSDRFGNTIFDHVSNIAKVASTKIVKNLKNTTEQIRIIKAFYKRTQFRDLRERQYSCEGIGFETIDLPTLEEYGTAISPYKKAWKMMKPLPRDAIIRHFKDHFVEKGLMREVMEDKIQYYFKKDKAYSGKEIVDAYDDMNQDMFHMLARHKAKYKSIRKFLESVKEQASSQYEEDIFDIKKSSYLSQEEKDNTIEIATHNYSVLTNNLIVLTNMVAVYHNIQLKILITSYERYKRLIQKIYDDCIDEV